MGIQGFTTRVGLSLFPITASMPSPEKRNSLTLQERKQAVVTAHTRHPRKSKRDISKETGVARATVTHVLDNWARYGSIDDPNTKPGPKPGSHNKVDAGALARAVASMQGRDGVSLKTAAASIPTSTMTLSAAAHHAGMVFDSGRHVPFLTAKQRSQCLAFAKTYKRKYMGVPWRDAFYTDSKIFHCQPRVGDTRQGYWDMKGQHLAVEYSRGGKKVHVYGGVCRFGATPLVFVTGTSGLKSKYKRERTTSSGKKGTLQSGVCGKEYVTDILPKLLAECRSIFEGQRNTNWVFVQDKAPVHPGGIRYLKEKGQLVVEDWPSKGMDINIIENVWAEVDKKMALAYDPERTFPDYKHKLEEVWHNVCTLPYLKKCAESVPSRLEKVVKAQGGMSPH